MTASKTPAEPAPPPTETELRAALIAACARVKAGVAKLEHDSKNTHSNYRYASIDRFLDAMRPLLSEQGLVVILDETSCTVVPPAHGAKKGSVVSVYAWTLYHQDGGVLGPFTIHQTVHNTGPQSFGTSRSYALKMVYRQLFEVSTGEPDADESEQSPVSDGYGYHQDHGHHQRQRQRPQPKQETEQQLRRRYQRQIHALAGELGLTTEYRHALAGSLCDGVTSTSDMTVPQLQTLGRALQQAKKDGTNDALDPLVSEWNQQQAEAKAGATELPPQDVQREAGADEPPAEAYDDDTPF